MSVTTAMQGLTAAQHDTQRDNSKAAREPGYAQATGRFRRWWQVLGSNQRRLSRRFYRPLPLKMRMPIGRQQPGQQEQQVRGALPGAWRRPISGRAPREHGSRPPGSVGRTTMAGPKPNDREAPACSTSPRVTPAWRVIEGQSVRFNARESRPPRRSNDGQTILEDIQMTLKPCSDLAFLVELWGFEPQTSCMRWNSVPFPAVRGRSAQTPLTSRSVRRSPPPFTTVHCGW